LLYPDKKRADLFPATIQQYITRKVHFIILTEKYDTGKETVMISCLSWLGIILNTIGERERGAGILGKFGGLALPGRYPHRVRVPREEIWDIILVICA